MTGRCTGLAILVALGTATDASARQAARAAEVTPLPPDYALLRYNPRELDDRQFASLAKAIADSSDSTTWPTVIVQKDEGVLGVVDRVYDFYLGTRTGDTTDAAPLTVEQLAEIIRTANGLVSNALPIDKELRVPPMIGRPQTVESKNPAPLVVAWTPDSKAAIYSAEGWRVQGESGSGRQRANVIDPGRWEVDAFQRLGVRQSSDITVALTGAEAQALARQGIGSIPETDRVHVEFLQTPACSQRFPPSAYGDAARAQVTSRLQGMKAAAAKVKLVLVDHGFRNGHGAEVRRVVERVLAEFGAADLLEFVVNFELDRTASPAPPETVHEMVRAMQRYNSYLNNISVNLEDERSDAAGWFLQLTADATPATRNTVPIAPYALQAALASNIQAGAWLNLSWRGDRPDRVMPVELRSLLAKHEVFAAVAAGNENNDVLHRAPQLAAAEVRNFVNVTNGTADGDVCGSRTGTEGVRVHLMTEGRSTDTDGAAVFGSSFATPVVATAAWLRHLMDRTPAAQMRERLVAASSYFPDSPLRTVDSKGVFDAGRLLANVGAHYVAADTGLPVPLTAMALDAGHCGRFGYNQGETATQDLVVYRRGSGFEIAVRDVDFSIEHRTCTLPTALTFTATLDGGGSISASTPGQFVALVKQLHF